MAQNPKTKKPGPRGPWQLRARYQRAKCDARLKPVQVENLSASDAFARWVGAPLNTFVTIRFSDEADAKSNFEKAICKLSKWHKRWGGKWFAIHVWEAIGGFHVHIACHCPKQSNAVYNAIRKSFAGHDTDIRPRTAGQGMLAYLCKGTDVVTHSKLRGPRGIKARAQGIIPWKRCGTTQNIGCIARKTAKFDLKIKPNNCVKTSPHILNQRESQRTSTSSSEAIALVPNTYVVSDTLQTSASNS